MNAAITPHQSSLPAGRDGFLQLLHAEWTKFRTVRGWLIGVATTALLIVLLAVLTASGSHSDICSGTSPQTASCHTGHPPVPVGPGGEPVTDSFYFVHQPLNGNGTITVRLSSLTGRLPVFSAGGGVSAAEQSPQAHTREGLEPWSKAGLIVKESTHQGSAYAAIMLTGGHGVRMQYDYVHDTAASATVVSAASPRWLRLTRTGTTVTGYESNDGSNWTKVGTARVAGRSATVQAGLFAASPDATQTDQHLFGGTVHGGPTTVTAVFDHVSLQGQSLGGGWRGDQIGASSGGQPEQTGGGFKQFGGQLTVTGSGDIAPAVGDSVGERIESSLAGGFVALIAAIIVATLFITAEYRRGLIRTTLAASPRRGRVLAAKAIVIGSVTFAAGLAGAAVAVPLGDRILRSNGNYVYPVSSLTEVRVIVGTAALLAVAAILALAAGTVLRRSAGAVTAVIVLIVLPYILAVASALPADAARWLLRITPAAGFAIQQTLPQYSQVSALYTPTNGYYPLAPWAGVAVLCAYAALALTLATYLLRRRDV